MKNPGSATPNTADRNTAYDVIGDIHGHYDKLVALLELMGYVSTGDTWRPPQGRKAAFLGDLIDRGPKQVETVNLVRAMVDNGDAYCVLGNHEFNAIAYATNGPDGSPLREHSEKNDGQHAEFLRQVGKNSARHIELLNWFRTLPVALDLGGIRAVHAWWHQDHIERIRLHSPALTVSSTELLVAASTKNTPEWAAVEGLTKGLEVRLPEGCFFVDHSGKVRHEARTRWWLDNPQTLREVAIIGDSVDQIPADLQLASDYPGKPVTGAPVFVGHYWMEGTPAIETSTLACLDWSVGKGGPIVAYRWDGETELQSAKLVAC